MNKYSMKKKLKWAQEVKKYIEHRHRDWADEIEITNNKITFYASDYGNKSSWDNITFDLENETVSYEVDYPRWFEGFDFDKNKTEEDKIKVVREECLFNDIDKLKGIDTIIDFFNKNNYIGWPYLLLGSIDTLPNIDEINIIDKDIIYSNIQNSNKLKIHNTESNGFSIITIDTNIPIITFEPIDNCDDSFYFLVDIQDEDEFRYKTRVETTKELNEAIDFTLDIFNNHRIFSKYVDDIEKLKQ